MFSWIPMSLYQLFYYYFLMLLLFIVVASLFRNKLESKWNTALFPIFEMFTFVLVCLFVGQRPVSGIFFGDMYFYDWDYTNYKAMGISYMPHREYVWGYYMYLSSLVMTAQSFFTLTFFIYIFPMYLVSKRHFKKLSFVAFFLFISAFSFWGYGTNGLRNGIATSLFLLVFLTDKRWIQLLIMLLAVNIHASIYLVIVAFIGSHVIKTPKKVIYLWAGSIIVSFLAGSFLQTYVAGIMDDGRSAYLTVANYGGESTKVGFRWDFILYSSCAVFAGWYYIVKLKFQDKIYYTIWATYVIGNAFWVILIRANYSNRFAYLSWFLMALVLIYPLLKRYIIPHQHKVVGYITIAYFAFTFLMNIILF